MRHPLILTSAVIATVLAGTLIMLPIARATISRALIPTVAPSVPPTETPSTEAPPVREALPVLSEPDIAARVAPSVVQIQTEHDAGPRADSRPGDDPEAGHASGVKIAEGIVTNDHAVADADRVQVVASDGRRGTAVVVKRAPALDLVLLQPDLDLPSLELETASEQRQGDAVLVLGYPRPDALGPGPDATLTRGLISAIRRDQEGVAYVQTDAAVDPGSSGGAMVNLRGQLIGIPTFGLRGSPSLNFAVSADAIQSLIQESAPGPVATGPRYRGQPDDILLTPNDLGPDWKAAGGLPADEAGDEAASDGGEGDQEVSDTEKGDEATQPSATARLVRGDPSNPRAGFTVLLSIVNVEDDPARAQIFWERAVRHPSGGLARQPDPGVADECRAYTRTVADRAELQVVCREANVVVGVVMEGASDVATYDAGAFYTGIMTERVRNGSQ